jgi:hypothetical protein
MVKVMLVTLCLLPNACICCLQEEQQCAAADMRESIQQLRLVLHESVMQQAQIGQTALQLIAAHAAAADSGQQQLVQQLVQGADLALLCTPNNSSSSSSSSEQQQQQQVLLQACMAAAWPTVIQPSVFVAEPGSLLQAQHVGAKQQEQQPGVMRLLQPVQGIPSIGMPQQQQQQQEQLPTEQQLVPRLVQLLLGHNISNSSSSNEPCSSTDAGSAAAAAADSVVGEASTDIDTDGSLQLQHHISYTCNVLLLRALSDAPPPSDAAAWNLGTMANLLELLLDVEAVKSQAADAAYSAELDGLALRREQQQQQQQGIDSSSSSSDDEVTKEQQQQHHHEHDESLLQPPQHYMLDGLFKVLNRMRQLKEQLGSSSSPSAAAAAASSSSASAAAAAAAAVQQSNSKQQQKQQRQNGRSPRGSQQQQQQDSLGPQSLNARARLALQQQQHDSDDDDAASVQQQEEQQAAAAVAAAAEGEDFWRQQAVQLYRSSRPDGWKWLNQQFGDVSSSNNQPGFWGLVS